MPARKSPPWSAEELAIMREHYPRVGLNGVCSLLNGRSSAAIYVMANKLGLKAAILANTPQPRLAGGQLEEAITLREDEGWSFARIGAQFGVSEAGALNAVMNALCRRKGFTPAQRDATGRLLPEGLERLRLMLRKGMKGIDIQLRLGISAGRIAEERRRYRADLKARGKAPLPAPGAGVAYSGVKLQRAKKAEVEALFMQGLGTKKIFERTGVSHTSIGRIRARLVKRLARKGESLPGCDLRGARHVQAESSRFITPDQEAELRRHLLARVPVRSAALAVGIGSCSAYRIRDRLAAELALRGEKLPPPILPGRIRKADAAARKVAWLPKGARNIYRYRGLLRDRPPEQAKELMLAEITAADAAERQQAADIAALKRAEAARPKTFEEKLAAVRAGAKLTNRIDIRKPDPTMTLGGIATGAL